MSRLLFVGIEMNKNDIEKKVSIEVGRDELARQSQQRFTPQWLHFLHHIINKTTIPARAKTYR